MSCSGGRSEDLGLVVCLKAVPRSLSNGQLSLYQLASALLSSRARSTAEDRKTERPRFWTTPIQIKSNEKGSSRSEIIFGPTSHCRYTFSNRSLNNLPKSSLFTNRVHFLIPVSGLGCPPFLVLIDLCGAVRVGADRTVPPTARRGSWNPTNVAAQTVTSSRQL